MARASGALWAAIRHNILPGEYYAYELWQPDRKVNIDNYLYSNEAPRLFKLLNKPSQPDPVDDKLAFHGMCTTHALPSPTILAAFTPVDALLAFKSGRAPEQDLFVKPRFGMSGHGSELFRWNGGAFVTNRCRQISTADVSHHIATLAKSQNRSLIVQPLLTNHPSLSTETKEALATARLVTGRRRDGDIVPIFGFIYFAKPDSITNQHGSVALIDVANGRLMPGPKPNRSATKLLNESFDHASSDTGILPDWNSALRYVEIAHRACSNFVFLGWDIAFTGSGPMLLECNANWTADEYQSISGRPLGLTKFTEILADHLRSGSNQSID